MCALNRFIQATHYTRRSTEFFGLTRATHNRLLVAVAQAKAQILDKLFPTKCYLTKKGEWRCDGWQMRSCAYQVSLLTLSFLARGARPMERSGEAAMGPGRRSHGAMGSRGAEGVGHIWATLSPLLAKGLAPAARLCRVAPYKKD